jgi:hypothetical protein
MTHGAALTVLGVALAMAGALPGSMAPSVAQEQGVSISLGTFYDRLAPYGEWVFYHGRYVWVPTQVGPGWQPYVVGRWDYTEPYGWMWVSDEPYAWAVYHYGRWGFDPAIGWFWVPDTVWGPAWVDWRSSDEDVAWAPLPPTTIGLTFGPEPSALPVNYWVAVPVTGFLAPNLSVHVIYKDRDRLDRILKRTRPAGRVKVQNNIVINNVINVNFIEQKTKKKVVVRKVEKVARADQSGKVKGDEIAIFAPTVEKKGDAKPKKVRNLEEVVKERREKQPREAAIEEQATDKKARKDKGVVVEEEPADKKGRKAKEAVIQEQSTDKKARKDKGVVVEEEPADKKGRKAKEAVIQEQSTEKKARKEKARVTEEPTQPTGNAEQRQKKQKTGLASQQGQGSADEQRSGGKKAERKARQAAEQQPVAAEGGGEQQKKKKRKNQEQTTD